MFMISTLRRWLTRRPATAWREGERHLDERPADWRPAHRDTSPLQRPGRHTPGRGRWADRSRQGQLDEGTLEISAAYALREDVEVIRPHEHTPFRDGLRIRCSTCLLDVARPGGMPEVGAGGFSSWT